MYKEIQEINPNELYFDINNPRISEFNISTKAKEEEIIAILWNVMGVEEIVLSIKASGFFPNEPLIALKENGRNIVIEGNRRLAAVKCILAPSFADTIGFNKNLLSVSGEIKSQLNKLPVIFVDSRQEAWKFIGFKHINGPAKWGSYAKAQYISQIRNEFGISLEEIASQIGDTNKTVQKLYQGLKVIEQAESLGRFDRRDIQAPRLYFSHLYTGLNYEGIRDYLSLKDISPDKKNPVPEESYENLEYLLTWLYGSKRKESPSLIQSQNPDLKYLDAVLKNKEAELAIKDGIALMQAYEISQPKNKTFEQNLLEAKRALQKAQSYLTEGFDGKDENLLKHAATIAQIADDLYDSMEKKWKSLQGTVESKKRLFGGE
ncbi:MAG TPA: ParB N-terminal domain-containing protein [Hanamia sp.]